MDNDDIKGGKTSEQMQNNKEKVEWRDNRSLAECAKHLYETKVMLDVTFTFKKYGDRKLQAHRLILSMRSAMFEAMFFGPMANSENEIDIEDVDPDIFDLVLGYIYTDKVDLNGETVLKCLYAAEKYCLSGLVTLCSSFLKKSISSDTVCTIYEQAKFFNVEELRKVCYTFIIENSNTVFKKDDIKTLSYESLLTVMGDEKLQSEELLLFQTALRWADAKCTSENIESSSENKRKVLKDILSLIRFPVIPPNIFANVVIPTQILPAEEQIRLLQFMVTRATETPGRVGRFISLPRRDKCLIVDLENVGSLGTYTSGAHIFKLRSNFDLRFLSFSTFNFTSLKIDGKNLNSNLSADDFHILDGNICVKTSHKIVFRAGNEYILNFDLPRTHIRYAPQTTIRRVCHVAAFGELKIKFEELPERISKITFCRI
ncbi:BTB/POZ domain-containing protein 6-B-like [Mercenaria mercenaria]|uniref:BTB/POZ domain-containing protein 6-B-like n=1 Tax=Mercenaria mercenaria TaxID=6596 RepID=UPI00234FA582|nr:BTB/POZ domain-containing protein 6-B-like [Mercenaria mercenaria]